MPNQLFVKLLVIMLIVTAVMLLSAGLANVNGSKTTYPVEAPTSTPMVIGTAEPVVIGNSLHLELDLPVLSDVQLKYLREAKVLPRCPMCFGIDKPAVPMDDNQLMLFAALLFTESGLNPYDENGNTKISTAGCMGIGQLCGDLLVEEARHNDELNLYIAADHLSDLLEQENGDVNVALRRYKGITTEDTKWQADSVLDYLKIRSGK